MISWVTDVGENAVGFPHELTIDLGEVKNVRQATVRFPFEGGSARRVTVSGSRDSDSPLNELGTVEQQAYASQLDIPIQSPSRIRFLHLRFEDPRDDRHLLMVGEIDAM